LLSLVPAGLVPVPSSCAALLCRSAFDQKFPAQTIQRLSAIIW
jgi:hypothetical protein